MIYTKATQSTLIDGKVLGKNFKWRVIDYGYDVINNKTFVNVEHFYTTDQMNARDVDVRRYTKNGLVANLDLTKVENYLKTLTQYKTSA